MIDLLIKYAYGLLPEREGGSFETRQRRGEIRTDTGRSDGTRIARVMVGPPESDRVYAYVRVTERAIHEEVVVKEGGRPLEHVHYDEIRLD